ncbi:MAG: alpha/beta hydrolase [Lacisediminihabitans sp.]
MLSPRKPVVLLVHGSMQGAWCWSAVATALDQRNVPVDAFDLPGHGRDTTPRPLVSVRSYTDEIIRHIDLQDRAVILVGHSMAGYAISKALEQRASKIAHLVFFSAQARAQGQSWLDTLDPATRALYRALADAADDGSFRVPNDTINSRWLSSVSPDSTIARFVRSHVTPQPIQPLLEPAELTGFNSINVPITYIWPVNDVQNNHSRMEASLNNLGARADLMTIPGDHEAMLTHPRESASAIHTVWNSTC